LTANSDCQNFQNWENVISLNDVLPLWRFTLFSLPFAGVISISFGIMVDVSYPVADDNDKWEGRRGGWDK